MNKKQKSRFTKIAMSVAAAFLMASSALSIAAGRLNYSNYWGDVVFAPFAFIMGVLLLIAVMKSGKKPAVSRQELLETPLKDYHKW